MSLQNGVGLVAKAKVIQTLLGLRERSGQLLSLCYLIIYSVVTENWGSEINHKHTVRKALYTIIVVLLLFYNFPGVLKSGKYFGAFEAFLN